MTLSIYETAIQKNSVSAVIGEADVKAFDMLKLMQNVKADPNFNLLLLLGLEPWIIRALDSRELKRFLKDYRKLAAKYFHPDLSQDPLKRDCREWYMKALNSAVDRLLADDFLLAMSQEDLPLGKKRC